VPVKRSWLLPNRVYGVSSNTEGGQTADGRCNPPTNFGPLIGDLLGMRNLTPSHVAAPMPLDQSLEGARESPLGSPGVAGKASGCAAGAQRAHCGQIDRPISVSSMWIVTA
jgi:hypothetical protein